MTLAKDESGRAILEGTVYVAIAFSDKGGNILGSRSSPNKRDVEVWGENLIKVHEDLKLPVPIIKLTLASIREML